MRFTETSLMGAFVVEVETVKDDRGFFARSWCRHEYERLGLNTNLMQCNISFNKHAGTLRGMHYQLPPYQEAKVVRCTMGAIFDVIIDLRPDSKNFKQWEAFELTASNRKMVYIPEGFAHGFLTLTDNVEVFYQMTEFYHSECATGVRWNDPLINIKWPIETPILSQKDSSYLDLL